MRRPRPLVRIAACVAALAAASCGPAALTVQPQPWPGGERALNDVIELAFDGPLDPLSVDAASVRVVRDDGREVETRRSVRGGRLWLELVVTAGLLDEALRVVNVRLAGLPAPRALRTLDGRALARTRTLRIPVTPRLRAYGTSAPRLRALNGSPPSEGPFPIRGPLTLRFDGVLDPASVTDAACPLFPIVGALDLDVPVLPRAGWSCVGSQFDVSLVIPAGAGRLRLVLRRFGLRDLSGRSPEPALRAELDAS